MDGVTALVAGLISGLRALLDTDVVFGGWAWAITVLGIVVGLLPAAGAFVLAVWRKGIGSSYGGLRAVGIAVLGVVSAGLLPWTVFTATGDVVRSAAAGTQVTGLRESDVAALAEPLPVPFADVVFSSQGDYLAGLSVRQAFDPSDPAAFGLAIGVLAVLPLIAVVLVLVQARIALRRGPAWPAKLFWLPALALPFLTAATPAGSSGHLWIGVVAGAFVGIFLVLLAGRPSRERVRRSLEPAASRRSEGPPRGADPYPPRPEPVRTPIRSTPVRTKPPAPTRPEDVGAERSRLAERFAARPPEPLVSPPRSGVGPTPTLVAPGPLLGGALLGGAAAAAGARRGEPRFRMIRRLGQGGFGKVWLAHDAQLGHPVALKAAHAPDGETEERIRREATALRSVRHPHCVRIFDLVDARSDPGLAELDGLVIVMEHVEGTPLGELVRSRGLLDDIAAARAWASVAGALDAAHQRGVMHRDVKPGNVIVDAAGYAHLIDFGIARRTGDATLTVAGFVLGTPDFLAPEVAGGQRATPQSDSWQLAATISYALSGQPPRGSHADAVSGLRAAAAGAPLSQLPSRSAHTALLYAAMHNDPAQRPPLRTAREALENWLRSVDAAPDGPVTQVTNRR
ncbi:protein kinase [Pseudonocardia sp. KRD-184]|uniref:non-specific serine/threonine protein kinase n=1 Tax=Pseudonocardia oceani TaxID=2792013 RepID=A0ABS6UI95_9PSEU|nr:serine/threonine-protein kinase [Pseudonocardia oceani]MBW0090867.1 protein kinase [Pseudonocardia oceani]MBW0096671.1 protein kinase [Pseudonocardia oceani]MBW0110535.1 protein kinase [Pseudonocardia oceani]MBW0122109.1 protein kinase [Pseudonocardia oceani]MBW0131989.1 protein kinase [Pseudonocardia oceani]